MHVLGQGWLNTGPELPPGACTLDGSGEDTMLELVWNPEDKRGPAQCAAFLSQQRGSLCQAPFVPCLHRST